jgi:hypothetical protein
MIHWFGYFKKQNEIIFSSVNFNLAVPFLRGRDFCIEELSTVKENKEVNLLWPNEEPEWVLSNHYLEISGLLEKDDFEPIYSAKIKLKEGGCLYFNYGNLRVRYPKGEDLKEDTANFLRGLGYFAAEQLWEFSEQNPQMHLLEFIVAMEPRDITDEFERMKAHTEGLDALFQMGLGNNRN